MKLKKLVSLNPNKYSSVDVDALIETYALYILGCIHAQLTPKKFSQWLDTEI
jgi:hypothetical protein